MEKEHEPYLEDQNSPYQCKIMIWERVCYNLEQRIGRNLLNYESETIAFVLENRFCYLNLEKNINNQLFELKENDKSITILIQIHRVLAKLLKNMYREIYIADTVGELYVSLRSQVYRTSLYDKLTNVSNLILEFAERAYQNNETELIIPSIPLFLVPVWVSRSFHNR